MRILKPVPILGFVGALLLVLSIPAYAVNGVTRGYDREFSEYLQANAARVQPSVVGVLTRFVRTVHENGVAREIVYDNDFGSGFIYNREGIVVTSLTTIVHPPSSYVSVMSGASEKQADYVRVLLQNGHTYEAEVVGTDKTTGIAVLRLLHIPPEESVPLPIGNSGDVIIGEPILFLGYNAGTQNRIGYDFGVISTLRPKFPTIEESTNQYFQINVPQVYGNQGGVVVNSKGETIATMTGIAPYPQATQIHFALPINATVEVVDAILDVGAMHRPWLGFRLLEMNPQIERAYSIISDMNGDGLVTDSDRELFKNETGIDLKHCLFVIYIDDDSPAGDAGLREADILTEFNGVPVTTMDELSNQIERYRVGDIVTLQWMRREYTVWDPYIVEVTMEYSGQRDDEEKATHGSQGG